MTDLKMNVEQVKDFILNGHPEDRIYIGCDSALRKRDGKWFAYYITVCVIHKAGKHGCKIFGNLEIEPDYVPDKRKPVLRLLNEAMKAASLYEELKDAIGDKYREIHLDINPDERFNSHMALSQAVGYVRGVVGLDPIVKPDAFAAQYAADRFMRVKNYDLTKPDNTLAHSDKRRKRKRAA